MRYMFYDGRFWYRMKKLLQRLLSYGNTDQDYFGRSELDFWLGTVHTAVGHGGKTCIWCSRRNTLLIAIAT
jgi:hypothetical protein